MNGLRVTTQVMHYIYICYKFVVYLLLYCNKIISQITGNYVKNTFSQNSRSEIKIGLKY